MPRRARQKHPEAVYHVMSRSISEVLLFKDDIDKDFYLKLLKRYVDKYQCKVYAYCLMDNHVHIHLDTSGFDISKFMHSLNTAYVRYYNKKYDRHGPLFQGRFDSRILDSDRYNIAVSAYIHNNPKDIPGYSGREERYKYSSYGVYLGIKKDTLKLIDKSFVMSLIGADSRNFARKYLELAVRHRNTDNINDLKDNLEIKTENEYLSGRRIIARDMEPYDVISLISERLSVSEDYSIALKGKRRLVDYRAFCAFVLRVLAGLSYKQICNDMYNITISGCAKLCEKGQSLLKNGDSVYAELFTIITNAA